MTDRRNAETSNAVEAVNRYWTPCSRVERHEESRGLRTSTPRSRQRSTGSKHSGRRPRRGRTLSGGCEVTSAAISAARADRSIRSRSCRTGASPICSRRSRTNTRIGRLVVSTTDTRPVVDRGFARTDLRQHRPTGARAATYCSTALASFERASRPAGECDHHADRCHRAGSAGGVGHNLGRALALPAGTQARRPRPPSRTPVHGNVEEPLPEAQVLAVEAGRLTLMVSGQEQTITQGDQIIIPAEQPVALRNAGTAEAAVILVTFPSQQMIVPQWDTPEVTGEEAIAPFAFMLPGGGHACPGRATDAAARRCPSVRSGDGRRTLWHP